jgi:hypothetical protein
MTLNTGLTSKNPTGYAPTIKELLRNKPPNNPEKMRIYYETLEDPQVKKMLEVI